MVDKKFGWFFWFCIMVGMPLICSGQIWIDKQFQISTNLDLVYGESIDFGGQPRSLMLDISQPTDDIPPECGRPLAIIIHGGAWVGGDKNDSNPKRLREDFASRGYVAASFNYRLGVLHTDQDINCNIPDWNCFNVTDSSEWYRANYRAVQDIHGGIRFLLGKKVELNIDPNNVFIIGESAGAFIAMGVGYIDDQGEVINEFVSELPDAPKPNNRYESSCIQAYDLANSIDEINTSRPDLGNYLGVLNNNVEIDFKIQAVGNLFGASFNNIFPSLTKRAPALYMFHQPCDLIVPHNLNRLLTGYNNCLRGFPANCGNIGNRLMVGGSSQIQRWIDDYNLIGTDTIPYLFELTSNNADCFQQVTNPSLACHALDNFEMRTGNMAAFFSGFIESCFITSTSPNNIVPFRVYPNPVNDILHIHTEVGLEVSIKLLDSKGRVILADHTLAGKTHYVDMSDLQAGIYFVSISNNQGTFFQKVMKL